MGSSNDNPTTLKKRLQEERDMRRKLERLVAAQRAEIKKLRSKVPDPSFEGTPFQIQNIEFIKSSGSNAFNDLLSTTQESHNFVQLVLDTTPNFICVRDVHGDIKLINKPFAEVLLGEDRKALHQINVSDFYTNKGRS